jgi:hypothetical protein
MSQTSATTVAAVTSPTPGVGSSRRTRPSPAKLARKSASARLTSTVMASIRRRPASNRPRAEAGMPSSASQRRPAGPNRVLSSG